MPQPDSRRRLRRLAVWTLSVLGVAAAALWLADTLDPLPPFGEGGARVVVAEDGTPLRNYPSRDGVWRYPVRPDQVSPRYLETLLTYEDRWFYWHPGVNPAAMARAGWQWVAHGRIVSGGSTLTMQVARMLDPELSGQPSRNLPAKWRQVWRAIQLEMHYSKDEILSLYLSHAPMGGIVEGVEMGSRLWLGKPASDLSDAEAALLTALPQAPSRLRPDRHPQAAAAARDKVLARMAERGVWTPERVADARIENVVAPPLRARWLAPLAAQRLLAQAPRGQRDVVVSTLDADLQATVERRLEDRVDAVPPK
ncbi:MAG: transglycosylase domain-containing protein, partial [Bordetella sp.]|nr:transglycosylase domain-containing protein [Bordetella sp.]